MFLLCKNRTIAKQVIAVANVEILIPERGKINQRLSIFVKPLRAIKAKTINTAATIKTGFIISILFGFSSFKIRGQPPSFRMIENVSRITFLIQKVWLESY